MPIKVRRIWVDENNNELPYTDNKLYDVECDRCEYKYEIGVGRYNGTFLCLGCIDEVENAK